MSNQITENVASVAKTMDRLASLALDTAKKLGADEAKVITGASFQKRLVVEAKQFSLANSLESRSLAIAVHKDKKKGSASINTTNEDGVKRAVEAAMALASYSVPDEALTLPGLDLAPKAPPLPFLYDEALAGTTLVEIQSLMQEVLGRLTRDPRLALDRYEMAVDVSWHGLANSLGVRQEERQSMASWSFFGMARDGDEVTGFDYDGDFSFGQGGLLAKGLAGAGTWAAKVLGSLGARQCPSYKGPILLSPRAVQELLVGMIFYHAGGRQVMDNKSRWQDQVGKTVLSERVTIADDPHDRRFSGCTGFDGDGIPTKAMTIIDKGVLRLHLHDCYSAKKCKTKTTGSAGGPFACRVAPGDTPLADLLAARPQLLMVDRFSGNSDPVKGDFSGVAKASRLYVKGEDQGGVTETMIAGNFFDFAKKVLAAGDVAEMVGGGFQSPYLLVDDVSVTGG